MALIPDLSILNNPAKILRTLNFKDIWLGASPPLGHTGTLVPNVDDLIIDYNRNTLFRVMSVDRAIHSPGTAPTYIPLLSPWSFGVSSNINPLLPMQPSAMDMLFINTRETIPTLTVDNRHIWLGSESVALKFFRGFDTTDATGVVISRVYDGTGSLIGENVPLELIDPANPNLKRPVQFNSSIPLNDGETISCVAYTVTGTPTDIRYFKIKNSDAIRTLERNDKLIVDIVLESPFLDNSILDLIQVPQNLPLTASSFSARLIYSDGSTRLINVNTPKCKLYGVESFNTGITDVPSEITLVYLPDANEPVINASNSNNYPVTRIYRIKALMDNLANSFKIYIVPVFSINRYILKYYLGTVDYQNLALIPNNLITVERLDGLQVNYGQSANSQLLKLSVTISDILGSSYGNYRFAQFTTIDFNTLTTTPWVIDYKNNNQSVYGGGCLFKYSLNGNQVLDIKSGANTLNEWLNLLWETLSAIYDESIIIKPPTPTHFKLRYKGVDTSEMSVSNWNLYHARWTNDLWVENGTVEVIWLQEANATFKQLGVSPVVLRNLLP